MCFTPFTLICGHTALLCLSYRFCNKFKPSRWPWAIRGLQSYWDLCVCPLFPWSVSTWPEQWPVTESTFLFLPASRPPAAPGPKGRSHLDRAEFIHLWTAGTAWGCSGMRLIWCPSYLCFTWKLEWLNVSPPHQRDSSAYWKKRGKKGLFVALKKRNCRQSQHEAIFCVWNGKKMALKGSMLIYDPYQPHNKQQQWECFINN